MKQLDVNFGKNRTYSITIGTGLLEQVDRYVKDLFNGRKIAVISDLRVMDLYGNKVGERLKEAGFQVSKFAFEPGEKSKTLKTYGEILNFLAEEGFDREDLIVAVGGGVTGDLAGFAAATYMRGIDYVQVPTTLLAQVDSSVGGKTGIDLDKGKNLAGAFWQPKSVICDLEVLETLDEREYASGMGEVVKYGVLSGRYVLDILEKAARCQGLDFQVLEELVYRCIKIKKNLVEADEQDFAIRHMLNLGHTVGHGLEAISGYELSHGQAVSVGIAVMARYMASRGVMYEGDLNHLLEIMEKVGAMADYECDLQELRQAICSDKKISGDEIQLVMPEKLGHCVLETIKLDKLEDILREGFRYHESNN